MRHDLISMCVCSAMLLLSAAPALAQSESGGAAATGAPTSGGAATGGSAALTEPAAAPVASLPAGGVAGPEAAGLNSTAVLIGLGVGAAVVAGVLIASSGGSHSTPSTTGTGR
jgi:hypothetical protein